MTEILVQCIGLALLGGCIFSLIGIVPGTDETATMAPLTLVLVLLGFAPEAIFCWFVSIAVSMHITHIVPTALAALPVSVLFAKLLSPLGSVIQPYIGLIFTLAAILLADMSTAKIGAILALFPFAFLIQGMQFIPKIKQQQMRDKKVRFGLLQKVKRAVKNSPIL